MPTCSDARSASTLRRTHATLRTLQDACAHRADRRAADGDGVVAGDVGLLPAEPDRPGRHRPHAGCDRLGARRTSSLTCAPSVRCRRCASGRQPYGVLPVTPLGGDPDAGIADARERWLATTLKTLLDRLWHPRVPDVPRVGRSDDPAPDLAAVLKSDATSRTSYRLRHLLGPRYIDHLRRFLGEDLNASGWLARAGHDLARRAERARLQLASAPGRRGVRRGRDAASTAPLVQAGDARRRCGARAELHRRRCSPIRPCRQTRPIAAARAAGAGDAAASAAASLRAARIHGRSGAHWPAEQPALRPLAIAAARARAGQSQCRHGGDDLAHAAHAPARGQTGNAAAGDVPEEPDAIRYAPISRRSASCAPRSRICRRFRPNAASGCSPARWTSPRTASTPGSRRSPRAGCRAMRERNAGRPAHRRLRLGAEPEARSATQTRGRDARRREPVTVFAMADDSGFIHAPSIMQAQTAALLRNTHLTHARADARDLFAVDLSSRRVRLANMLLRRRAPGPAARRTARLPVRAPPARAAARSRTSTTSGQLAPLVPVNAEPGTQPGRVDRRPQCRRRSRSCTKLRNDVAQRSHWPTPTRSLAQRARKRSTCSHDAIDAVSDAAIAETRVSGRARQHRAHGHNAAGDRKRRSAAAASSTSRARREAAWRSRTAWSCCSTPTPRPGYAALAARQSRARSSMRGRPSCSDRSSTSASPSSASTRRRKVRRTVAAALDRRWGSLRSTSSTSRPQRPGEPMPELDARALAAGAAQARRPRSGRNAAPQSCSATPTGCPTSSG